MTYCDVLSKTCKSGKTEYKIRLEDGRTVRIDGEKLKEAVRAGVMCITNMKLTKDNKLILFDFSGSIDKIKKDLERKVDVHLRRYKCRKKLIWSGNNHSGYTLVVEVIQNPKNTSINPAVVTFKLLGSDTVDILGRRGAARIAVNRLKTDKDISALLCLSVEDAVDYMMNI